LVEFGCEETHGAGMSKRVGRDPLVAQGFAYPRRDGDVFIDEVLDGIGAEASTVAGGEQRVVGTGSALVDPGSQQFGGGRGERGATLFSAFAFGVDVGPDAEGDVAAVEPGQLRYPQTALDREQDQGVIALSQRGGTVGAASRASVSAGLR
jgi:hypothetical protein